MTGIEPGKLARWLKGQLTPEEQARADRARAQLEREDAQRASDRNWWLHHLTGLRLHDVEARTFERYAPATKSAQEAKRLMEAWEPSRKHGYLLYGNVGTGKTHLTKALALKWAGATPPLRSAFVSVADLMDQLKATFDNDKPDALTLPELMQKFTAPDLLMLDDLGAEKTTEWVQEKCLSLLDQRLSMGRHVFMTSNLDLLALAKRYDNRIVDRLRELMVFVKVDGLSYRGEIQQRNKEGQTP